MNEWVKVSAVNVAELMVHIELEPDAEELIHPELTPEGAVEVLVAAGHHYDAIRLLACGLPKRESVWWSCLVARQVQTPETDQNNIDALLAAEAWARDPSEDNRRLCRELSVKTRHETTASWAATAACWCTGSLAADGEPVIEPPEHLYAHAVAGAVTLAGMAMDADNPEACLEHFINQGIDLACGGKGVVQR